MKKSILLLTALLGLTPLSASAQTTTQTTTTQTASASFPSGATLAQLQAVEPLLADLGTLQSSRLDLERGRVVVVGLSAVDRLTLLTRLRSAGLPTNIVEYQTGNGQTTPTAPVPPVPAPTAPSTTEPAVILPTTTTLPTDSPLLTIPHAATLTGPQVVQAGQDNEWTFNLVNNGTQNMFLQHGACDVRFEVISAAGEIVRPDPKNTICTMQLMTTDVQPGETRSVQNIRWNGKDSRGQHVAAGQYTLRAVFKGAGVLSEQATLTITVR